MTDPYGDEIRAEERQGSPVDGPAEMLARAEVQLVLATQAIDDLASKAWNKGDLEMWGTDFANSRINLARQWTTLASQHAWLSEKALRAKAGQ